MHILAMDTVGKQGSVALLKNGKPVLNAPLLDPTGHVVTLPEQISRLLSEAGWTMDQVELVGVTLGPGSFTGLRIALGIAKGLVLGLPGVAVVGLSTLEVVGAGCGVLAEGSWVGAILDARRGELFFELYTVSATGFPLSVGPPLIRDPAALAKELAEDPKLTGPLYINGSGLGPYGSLFKSALGDRLIPSPELDWNPDPARLGLLAQERYEVRGGDDATTLQPLYLRRPDAVAKKRGL
jgi:tRNA threonylcarbamoyladenosine biosynthesis protein TsaB